MARYAYDRLSAQDASFLWAESSREPMHVGAVAILESGPLRNAEGGIDIDLYRRAVESVLHWIPRYRQVIRWTPIEDWPVWVDDRHFDLVYHIRHVALPKPGTLAQLKELSARILARRLSRERPLWEIWVIEGLEGGEQFALLNKIHHCMIDGAAGADLSQILLSPSQDVEVKEPLPYFPRPAPSPAELLADTVRHRVGQPLRLLAKAADALRDVDASVEDLKRRAGAFGQVLGYALQPASQSPINGPLSPHRRFDWLTMPLDDVLELRKVLECTVNDVVLATVAGAVRRYLFRHRVDLDEIDFRVATPVSTRKAEDKRAQGNHVSTWIVPMPLAEPEPLARLEAIREVTQQLKRKDAALAIDSLMAAAEYMPPALVARGASLAQGPINTMVTNVPGPRFPLYQLGAQLLGMYPMVPLVPGSGLGFALFSYENKLCWGINADFELVPDIEALTDDVRTSFEELRAAAVSRYLEGLTAPRQTTPPADADEAQATAAKRATPRRSKRSGTRTTRKPTAAKAARPKRAGGAAEAPSETATAAAPPDAPGPGRAAAPAASA